MIENTTLEQPHINIKEFYERLPKVNHTSTTQEIVGDFPEGTASPDPDWCLKQTRMLIRSLREAPGADDAYALFFKMFDGNDCRVLALRFYYMRWLLFATQKDAYAPPFRSVDERFLFAKVAMLACDKGITPELRKVLLSVKE